MASPQRPLLQAGVARRTPLLERDPRLGLKLPAMVSLALDVALVVRLLAR